MNNLYDLKAEQLTGAVVLLAVLMVIGFIGNLHVLFVYAFRIKPTNHGIYIIFLSVQDITACTLLIPLRIFILRNLWTHANEFTCRFQSFLMCLILTGSAFTLLLVATDRYRKICCPLGWQIKRKMAKFLCVIALMAACLCSWPVLVLNAPKTVHSKNVTIILCGTVDGYLQYQLSHRILMAGIFFAALFVLIALYILIFKAAKRFYTRHKINDTAQSSQNTNDPPKEQVDDSSNRDLVPHEGDEIMTCDNEELLGNTNLQSTAKNSKGLGNAGPERRDRSKKTTLAFILITVFYFISYIPFISLDIFLVHGVLTSFTSLTHDGFIAIQMVSACVFVNSVANCFIYGCLDSRFRQEIALMYKVLRCKK